jgi:hypothetical protein
VRKIKLLLAVAMAGAIGGNACAMAGSAAEAPACVITGADKLPAGLSGDAICAEIRAAARKASSGTGFSVEVRVVSASSLAARIRLRDGRTLPEQKMAVSDRQLNSGSIERFALAIASAVAGSAAR